MSWELFYLGKVPMHHCGCYWGTRARFCWRSTRNCRTSSWKWRWSEPWGTMRKAMLEKCCRRSEICISKLGSCTTVPYCHTGARGWRQPECSNSCWWWRCGEWKPLSWSIGWLAQRSGLARGGPGPPGSCTAWFTILAWKLSLWLDRSSRLNFLTFNTPNILKGG